MKLRNRTRGNLLTILVVIVCLMFIWLAGSWKPIKAEKTSAEKKRASEAKERRAVRNYYRAILKINDMHHKITKELMMLDNQNVISVYAMARDSRHIYDEALRGLQELDPPAGLRAVHRKLEDSLNARKKAADSFMLFIETGKEEFQEKYINYTKRADKDMKRGMRLLGNRVKILKIDLEKEGAITS